MQCHCWPLEISSTDRTATNYIHVTLTLSLLLGIINSKYSTISPENTLGHIFSTIIYYIPMSLKSGFPSKTLDTIIALKLCPHPPEISSTSYNLIQRVALINIADDTIRLAHTQAYHMFCWQFIQQLLLNLFRIGSHFKMVYTINVKYALWEARPILNGRSANRTSRKLHPESVILW